MQCRIYAKRSTVYDPACNVVAEPSLYSSRALFFIVTEHSLYSSRALFYIEVAARAVFYIVAGSSLYKSRALTLYIAEHSSI